MIDEKVSTHRHVTNHHTRTYLQLFVHFTSPEFEEIVFYVYDIGRRSAYMLVDSFVSASRRRRSWGLTGQMEFACMLRSRFGFSEEQHGVALALLWEEQLCTGCREFVGGIIRIAWHRKGDDGSRCAL